MPELPEVETIKNSLAPRLAGLTFTGVSIVDTRPVQKLALDEFCRRLIGKKILGLSRRGKYLIFDLSGGEELIVHLRMTGALFWDPPVEEPFTRLEFYLDNRSRLVYTDVRRFGTIYLVKDASEIVGKLGIEPLDMQFTFRALAELLGPRSTPVKTVLLNQELIAGIGNMYADEALFAARIHPLRPGRSLAPTEIKSLHRTIIEVLKKGIRNNGASIRNYRRPDGATGTAHEEFAVAHREGEVCPHCGNLIVRIVVSQRGTYLCPHCQRLDAKTRSISSVSMISQG